MLYSCSSAPEKSEVSFSFDSKGNYTGFSNLKPSEVTEESAENAGYVVRKNLATTANEEIWNNFVSDSSKNKDSYVRIASFFDDGGPYFNDIYYREGNYYLFDSSAETNQKSPFKYLLTLEGKDGIPEKDSGIIILTDDKNLTFEEIKLSLYSSSTEVINSISPYKLVTFYTP